MPIMEQSKMRKLFQMGSTGGHASDAVQVSPPVQGGPGGGGKSQAGKAEVNNPSQYKKPATLGPRKGNMKTPKFEDVVANIKAVKEGKITPEEAVVALYFEEDSEEGDGDGEGSEEGDDSDDSGANPDDGGGGATEKIKNPGALAAYIGRKKYGKKRFQQMAAKGDKAKTMEPGGGGRFKKLKAKLKDKKVKESVDVSEADPPAGSSVIATAKGSNDGQAPTPKVDGPKPGELLTFPAGTSGDSTKMGTWESQLRKWLDDALSQKKLWVGGIFIHKNGPNEFYLDGIASGTVSLDAAVKACIQFGDRTLAPPGAPANDLK